MNELLITCGCRDTDKFAADAFKILFPAIVMPPIRQGIGHKEPEIIKDYATALIRGKEKFAYYFKWDSGDLEAWDLLRGVRIE